MEFPSDIEDLKPARFECTDAPGSLLGTLFRVLGLRAWDVWSGVSTFQECKEPAQSKTYNASISLVIILTQATQTGNPELQNWHLLRLRNLVVIIDLEVYIPHTCPTLYIGGRGGVFLHV